MKQKVRRQINFNEQLRVINSRLKQEIRQRKKVEEELKSAYQRLADIIEFLPDPVFVIDKEKKVIAWNKALEEMTSVKKEEIIGKGNFAYAVPFYGKARPVLIDLIFMEDKEVEARYSFVRRQADTLFAEVFAPMVYGGKGAFLWLKASPLYDSKHNIVGAIETIRDITQHKEAEAILKKDKESLQLLMKERTEQLLKVQKELADARHLSEIGTLAATIAHELRNPLAAIRTAAYNIGKKSDDQRLKPHLENIDKKVAECDQIITNLLNYSRIKTPHFAEVKIHQLLNECIAQTRQRYSSLKIRLRKFCNCKENDTICADAVQLKELFNNVLNNAFEACEQNKGSITVYINYQPASHVTVVIEDTGIGIPAEHMKHLMQPFFTTKQKGTGLGLAVCQQLVNLHQGTISITSKVGKGTRVTINLPAVHDRS
ncbi:MAG: ATP-binding protein [Candidatus Omnitrophica bacterium]|nr:ATP-binding protein [Candidatus Omnitrophota bacterium]